VASLHSIWQEWHIYNVHNYVIHEDGERYQMLDGVEDWVRRSMKLRALSERRLRELQVESGWSNDQLVEMLSGDHDGNDTHDEEIYDRLSFNGLEGEASKYIPESELARIDG
jgi:hypothetical protein